MGNRSASENRAAWKTLLLIFGMVAGFILVLLVLGALAFWPIYTSVSKRAFEEHVEEIAERGESLDFDDLRPSPIDDPSENFAEAEAVARLLEEARAAELENPDDDAPHLFDPERIPGYEMATMRGKVRIIEQIPLEDSFPGLGPEEAAEVVLEHVAALPEFDAWITALERPGANFQLAYEEGYGLSLSEMQAVLPFMKLLHLRGRAALVAGDAGLAAESAGSLLRLSRHVAEEPALIFLLISATAHGQALSLIHEGLSAQAWSPGEMDRLRSQLGGIDWSTGLANSLRMERAVFVDQMLRLKDPSEIARLSGSPISNEMRFSTSVLPRGWLYDNARMFSQLLQEHAIDPGAPPGGRGIEEVVLGFQRHPMQRYRYLLVAIALPAYDAIGTRMLHHETFGDFADLALALELERDRSGSYPESIDGLTLVDGSAPIDPWTGEPFRYRREADSYLLYSTGPDSRDDGGKLKKDYSLGDWVWRLNLPPDFDRRNYLDR